MAVQEFKAENVIRDIDRLENATIDRVIKTVNVATKELQTHIQQSSFVPGELSVFGGRLNEQLYGRSGMLKRSIGTKPAVYSFGSVFGRTTFGTKYANIHFGSQDQAPRTMTSNRPNGYLAIPLPAAMDKHGMGAKPRDFADTFFHTSKAGNLIMFQNQGKRAGVVPLFLLKKSVTVPVSVHTEPLGEYIKPVIDKDLKEHFGEAPHV